MRELAIDIEYGDGADPITDVFIDHPNLVLSSIDISVNRGLVRVDKISGPHTALTEFSSRYCDTDICNECVVPDPGCDASRTYEILDSGSDHSTIYTFHEEVTYCNSVPFHAAMILPPGIVLQSNRRENRHSWHVLMREDGDTAKLYDSLVEGMPDGVSVSFQRLSRPKRWNSDNGSIADLTPEQRSALETAFELSYYGSPRNATLADLADALGVPQSTARYRLRRAEEWVVSTVLESSAE